MAEAALSKGLQPPNAITRTWPCVAPTDWRGRRRAGLGIGDWGLAGWELARWEVGGDRMGMMRLAWFSPVPPVPSGIATCTADLVSALSSEHQIDVYVDEPVVRLAHPLPGAPQLPRS